MARTKQRRTYLPYMYGTFEYHDWNDIISADKFTKQHITIDVVDRK